MFKYASLWRTFYVQSAIEPTLAEALLMSTANTDPVSRPLGTSAYCPLCGMWSPGSCWFLWEGQDRGEDGVNRRGWCEYWPSFSGRAGDEPGASHVSQASTTDRHPHPFDLLLWDAVFLSYLNRSVPHSVRNNRQVEKGKLKLSFGAEVKVRLTDCFMAL